MAPSATETITIPTGTAEAEVKLTSNSGPYKELSPIGYSQKAEEEGVDGFNAAKVSTSFQLAYRPDTLIV